MKKFGMQKCAMLTLSVLFAGALSFSCADEAKALDEQAFAKMLEKVLRDKPEILLNALKANSTALPEIIQEALHAQRKQMFIAEWEKDSKVKKKVNLDGRPAWGNADAPVTIVSYSDFTCSYCQQAAETVEAILERYKGKVRYVFKHLPIYNKVVGPRAAQYYAAASLQDAEKARRLYKAFFEGRHELVGEKAEPFMYRVANEQGLDMKRLAKDVDSDAVKKIVEQDMAEASALGFEGTPNFLVNDLVVRGALPADMMSFAIDTALEKAK